MLTYTGRRTIANCNIYADDLDPLTYYQIPATPTIAKDVEDKPIFSMVQYRRDVGNLTEEERKTQLGGGILTLSVELKLRPEQEQEIRDTLAGDPALHTALREGEYERWWRHEIEENQEELAKAIKLNTLPVMDGDVYIGILGETGGEEGNAGEFVASLVGGGKVSMTGNQRAAFQAKLTQDGSILLWNMLEQNLAAILVSYNLKFHHRLHAVTMSVWCDAQKSYHLVQEQWQDLHDSARYTSHRSGSSRRRTYGRDTSMNAGERVHELLIANQKAGVTITPEAPIEAEIQAELTQVGHQMLQDFIAATFLQYDPTEGVELNEAPTLETELAEGGGHKFGRHDIHQYSMKEYHRHMAASLNHEFKSQQVLEGHVGPQDNLANVLEGRDVNEFLTRIDLVDDWYKYLDVEVVCTTDFDEDPVDMVKAHLHYHGEGELGSANEIKDFLFQKDSLPGRFLTYLASTDLRSYDYELTVHYKGSAETYGISGTTDDTILVLDTDALGVLKVDVQMGLVDWDRIKQVHVTMNYGAGPQRKETQFVLGQSKQDYRWVEVIGAQVDKPYSYKVTMVDADNQHIELPEERSTSKQLVLNSPLAEELEVKVVPAGTFGEGGMLSRIMVALRYTDEANDYVVDEIVELARPEDSADWAVPLIDKELRSYEYQVKCIYTDGVVKEDVWRNTDTMILPVGDPFTHRIQIDPLLLDIGSGCAYRLATLDLEYVDPTDPATHTRKTLRIRNPDELLEWHFRMNDPARRTYSYKLSLYDPEGNLFETPTATETREVLVLRPPPA